MSIADVHTLLKDSLRLDVDRNWLSQCLRNLDVRPGQTAQNVADKVFQQLLVSDMRAVIANGSLPSNLINMHDQVCVAA